MFYHVANIRLLFHFCKNKIIFRIFFIKRMHGDKKGPEKKRIVRVLFLYLVGDDGRGR